jgi:hypothetical protein
VYDKTDKPIAQHPIDTRVSDLVIDPARKTPASGAADLADALASSEDARACLGQQVFRFARLRVESESDACLLAELESSVRSGASLKSVLVASVANEDLFWKR